MSRQAGLTALEMVVAAALLAVVLSLVVTSLGTSVDLQTQLTLEADAQRRGTQALERLADQLKYAGDDVVTLEGPKGAFQCLFQKKRLDTATGTVSLSDPFELRFALNLDELPNGEDDDGNGLADDGLLFLNPPDGEEQAICGNVLPGSLQVRPDSDRGVLQIRFQTAVRWDPAAGVYAGIPDRDGLYPDQDGFGVYTFETGLASRSAKE